MSIICMALVLAYLIAEFSRVADYTINIEQNTLYYEKPTNQGGFALDASDNDLILEISFKEGYDIHRFLKLTANVEPLDF